MPQIIDRRPPLIDPNMSEKAGFFDIQEQDWEAFRTWVNVLIGADEVHRALDLLANLPGNWRNQPPEWVREIRNAIIAKKGTATFYKNNIWDAEINPQRAMECLKGMLRGQLIEADVKSFTDQKLIPHIVDLGPGEYWLPIALHMAGYAFTYHDEGLHEGARQKAHEHLVGHVSKNPWDEKAPVIFVACELIEHLDDPRDILSAQLRHAPTADIIHISTPLGTYDTSNQRKNWRDFGDLGHLRTYTQEEFQGTIEEMFPDYVWQPYLSQPQHMRGTKK